MWPGSWYEAKLKVWKEYSQSWSAEPREDQGRFVMFIFVAGEVDMFRMAVVGVILVTRDARWTRSGVRIATVRARTARRVAKFREEMIVAANVGGVVVCCCGLLVMLLVSGIGRDRIQVPDLGFGLYACR